MAFLQLGQVYTADQVRSLPTVPSPDRTVQFSVVFVTGKVAFYAFDGDDSNADDGDVYLKPTDRTGAGRWVKVGSV